MPRPQFSLKTLLWVMVVVAAFFAGAEWGVRRDRARAFDERADLRSRLEARYEHEYALQSLLGDFHQLLEGQGIDKSELENLMSKRLGPWPRDQQANARE